MHRIADFAGRFFRMLAILENVVCAAGLFITTFMTFFQVLNRYWLHYQIIWLSDLSLFIFIGFMFLVIPLTTRQNGHTGVDVFVESVFAKRPLGRIGAVRAMSVTFLSPLVAMVSGALYLGEALTLQMLAGCAVVLLGTAMSLGLIGGPRTPR